MHRQIANTFALILGSLHVIVFILWVISLFAAFAFSGVYETVAPWRVILGHVLFLVIYLLLAGTTSTLIRANQNLERIADALGTDRHQAPEMSQPEGYGSTTDPSLPPRFVRRGLQGIERVEPPLRAT